MPQVGEPARRKSSCHAPCVAKATSRSGLRAPCGSSPFHGFTVTFRTNGFDFTSAGEVQVIELWIVTNSGDRTVVAEPGRLSPSNLIDARLTLLPRVGAALESNRKQSVEPVRV